MTEPTVSMPAWALLAWAALAAALAVSELAFAHRGRRDDPDARASDLLAIGTTLAALVVPVLLAVSGAARTSIASTLLGTGLALLGMSLRVAAMRGLHGRYALTPQQEPGAGFLVTTGPYRRVRHPGYLALVAAVGGMALVASGPWGLLAAVPMVLAALLRIAGEERMLLAEFGEEYRSYRARVRWRIVPWVY